MWIKRLNAKDVSISLVGPKNCYYDRKNKCGLSTQEARDVKGWFMDVTIVNLGPALDYLAFTVISLHDKLETQGFFLLLD